MPRLQREDELALADALHEALPEGFIELQEERGFRTNLKLDNGDTEVTVGCSAEGILVTCHGYGYRRDPARRPWLLIRALGECRAWEFRTDEIDAVTELVARLLDE